MTTLDRALVLALRLPVFPCLENKSPACPRGFKAASQDPARIGRLWKKHPGPLIGVPMGAASGLDALDIDPKHDGMAWWEQHKDAIPYTRAHVTRSGGMHILFRAHERVRNTQSKIAKGVDTRGHGGYIVWWPTEGCAIHNPAILDDWPEWLIKILLPAPPPPPPAPVTKCEADMRAAVLIERSFDRVRYAAAGQRHHTLRAAAKTIAGVSRFLSMSDSQLERYLVDLIMSAGAEDRANAEKTAHWAVDWGKSRPLLTGN